MDKTDRGWGTRLTAKCDESPKGNYIKRIQSEHMDNG